MLFSLMLLTMGQFIPQDGSCPVTPACYVCGDDSFGKRKLVSLTVRYTPDTVGLSCNQDGKGGASGTASGTLISFTAESAKKKDKEKTDYTVQNLGDNVYQIVARGDKLEAETEITIVTQGGTQFVEIHTSCSQPLFVDYQFGNIQVVDFVTQNGQMKDPACGPAPAPTTTPECYEDPSECPVSGCDICSKLAARGEKRPSSLSFRYVGGGPVCEECTTTKSGKMKQKSFVSGATLDPNANTVSMQCEGRQLAEQDGVFTFSGINGATNIVCFLQADGQQQELDIHTSCSAPLFVGQQFGGVVVSGFSGTTFDGSDVCPPDPCPICPKCEPPHPPTPIENITVIPGCPATVDPMLPIWWTTKVQCKEPAMAKREDVDFIINTCEAHGEFIYWCENCVDPVFESAKYTAKYDVKDTLAPVITPGSGKNLKLECGVDTDPFNPELHYEDSIQARAWKDGNAGFMAHDACQTDVIWTVRSLGFTDVTNPRCSSKEVFGFTPSDICGNEGPTGHAWLAVQDTRSPYVGDGLSPETVDCGSKSVNDDEFNQFVNAQIDALTSEASDRCSNEHLVLNVYWNSNQRSSYESAYDSAEILVEDFIFEGGTDDSGVYTSGIPDRTDSEYYFGITCGHKYFLKFVISDACGNTADPFKTTFTIKDSAEIMITGGDTPTALCGAEGWSANPTYNAWLTTRYGQLNAESDCEFNCGNIDVHPGGYYREGEVAEYKQVYDTTCQQLCGGYAHHEEVCGPDGYKYYNRCYLECQHPGAKPVPCGVIPTPDNCKPWTRPFEWRSINASLEYSSCEFIDTMLKEKDEFFNFTGWVDQYAIVQTAFGSGISQCVRCAYAIATVKDQGDGGAGCESNSRIMWFLEMAIGPAVISTPTDLELTGTCSQREHDVRNWYSMDGGLVVSSNCVSVDITITPSLEDALALVAEKCNDKCGLDLEVTFAVSSPCGDVDDITATISFPEEPLEMTGGEDFVYECAQDDTVDCTSEENFAASLPQNFLLWLQPNHGCLGATTCDDCGVVWSNDYDEDPPPCPANGQSTKGTVLFTASKGGNTVSKSLTFTITRPPSIPPPPPPAPQPSCEYCDKSDDSFTKDDGFAVYGYTDEGNPDTTMNIKLCPVDKNDKNGACSTFNHLGDGYYVATWPKGAWGEITVGDQQWIPGSTFPSIQQPSGGKATYEPLRTNANSVELHISCSRILVPGQVVWSSGAYSGQIAPVRDGAGNSVAASAYEGQQYLLLAPQPTCIIPAPPPPPVPSPECTPFFCANTPNDASISCSEEEDDEDDGPVSGGGIKGENDLQIDGCTTSVSTFGNLPVVAASQEVVGRPVSLTFMYTGNHEVSHGQESWSRTLVKPMRRITKFATLALAGNIWKNAPGSRYKRQPVGSIIVASASMLGRTKLPKILNIRVGTGKIRVDASGGNPLRLGDQWGSLQLVAFESDRGDCTYARCDADVDARCTIVDEIQERIGGDSGVEEESASESSSPSTTSIVAVVVVVANIAIFVGLVAVYRSRRTRISDQVVITSSIASDECPNNAVAQRGATSGLFL